MVKQRFFIAGNTKDALYKGSKVCPKILQVDYCWWIELETSTTSLVDALSRFIVVSTIHCE